MVTIEIRAIQRSRILEIRTDEDIHVHRLCNSLQHMLKEESPGILISLNNSGVLAPDRCLSEYGVRTGAILIYVSKTA